MNNISFKSNYNMPYLLNKQNQQIAYKKIKGKNPGIIFIHGLNSDMTGKKALEIENFAKQKKLSFLKFDCRGHGKSYGKFQDFTISDWKNDLVDMIDKKTSGQQILIGSSMGGWLMILASKMRKKRIKALIGLAPAPDFTLKMYKELPIKNKNEIIKKGITKIRKWNFTYTFTKNLFKDGKKNLVLKNKFNFNKPIILIHGLKDDVVSVNVSKKILKKISSKNIQLKLLKNSDHRLSSKIDINIILSSIEEILNFK